MTTRTPTRRRPTPPPPAPVPRGAVYAVAALVVGLVVVLGVALASARDDGDAAPSADFGTIVVEGAGLPPYAADAADAAVGAPAPIVLGQTPGGTGIEVGPTGEPTLVAFLAHWCPHCQAELPILVDLAASGAFDGIRTVAVLTGTNPDAPNHPPVAWLEREGWTGEVLLDDEAATAAAAYGLEGYPFLVAIGADGTVVGRTSGELPAADVAALAELARGT